MGLEPGDRIATLLIIRNSPRYYELLMAIWWAGGVIVPLNTRLAYPELRYITEHSQSLLLFGDESFRELGIRIGHEAPLLKAFVCLDGERYAEVIAHPPIDDACGGLDALAGICYTGGTTGLPKGVELTHLNFTINALGIQREVGHDPQTVYLHSTPLFHLADLANGLAATFGCGTHSFIDQFTTEVFYRRLREEGVTHVQLVPTMAAMILDAPERDDRLLSQVRSIAYGAAPISRALLTRAMSLR